MVKVNRSREQLLKSAKSLLHRRGYADVGVQELCDAAQVKKGSFYHFFPSKQALTIEALASLEEELMTHVLKPAFTRDAPPLERLKRFFQAVYAFQAEARQEGGCVLGCPFGNTALELSNLEEEIRLAVAGTFERTVELIRSTLQEAKEAGDLAPEIDPLTAARALFAYQQGILMMAKTGNDPELLKGQETMALRLCGVVTL